MAELLSPAFMIREFVAGLGVYPVDVEDATRRILEDPALTRAAVTLAVMKVSNIFDRGVKSEKLSDGASQVHDGRQFVREVVARGLALLDLRFGAKALGDYTPEEAIAYASRLRKSALTEMTRARFVLAVAKTCAAQDVPIRQQIQEADVEAVRRRVIEHSPDAEIAAGALAVA